MRVSLQILCILTAVIVLGCLLGPVVWLAMDAVIPGMHIPFNRILTRVFMVVAFVLLIFCRKSLRIQDSIRQSLVRPPRWFYLLRTGFILAVVSMFLLMVAGSFTGAVDFHPFELPAGKLIFRFFKALITGLVVAFIEEIFFRGFILQSLQKEMKTFWALMITSFFYAILHYFKARPHIYLDHYDWSAGFSAATRFFAPFHDLSTMIPGVIGLTFVGIVLGLAYLRTGSLYLSIGLHAGWVFLIKFHGTFVERSKEIGRVWFGDEKMVTGLAAWVMLAAVGAIVWLWGRKLAAPAEKSAA